MAACIFVMCYCFCFGYMSQRKRDNELSLLHFLIVFFLLLLHLIANCKIGESAAIPNALSTQLAVGLFQLLLFLFLPKILYWGTGCLAQSITHINKTFVSLYQLQKTNMKR